MLDIEQMQSKIFNLSLEYQKENFYFNLAKQVAHLQIDNKQSFFNENNEDVILRTLLLVYAKLMGSRDKEDVILKGLLCKMFA